ncbi:interleukin 15, like [Leuresthes tenuis]|uniref:interleukin 15, like n=1 Tax=Leuresthes tenuis TaxID=355514 RepID=UPI003B514E26
MLRGGSALVSVVVFSVCLLAVPLQKPCSQDIILRVKLLRDKAAAERLMDCRLYTPTIQDYENCPVSTLKCYAAEIQVLTEELELSGLKRFLTRKVNVQLKKLASLINQKESECRQCELFTENNVTTFLADLLSTLNMVNSQYC